MGALALLSAVAALAVPAAPPKDFSVPFRMPSGQIYCAYRHYSFAPIGMRCEIRSRIRPLPRRPRTCADGEWGAGYFLARAGGVRILCISDTVYDPHARVLAHGKTYKVDTFTCTSRVAGLTCRNRSGHGFFLSRAHSDRF